MSVIFTGQKETSLSVFFNHFSLSKPKVHICMSITVEADFRDNMREVVKKYHRGANVIISFVIPSLLLLLYEKKKSQSSSETCPSQ